MLSSPQLIFAFADSYYHPPLQSFTSIVPKQWFKIQKNFATNKDSKVFHFLSEQDYIAAAELLHVEIRQIRSNG